VALSRLQNLEQFLNLSNNHLQGEIPAELGELKLLRSLDLSSNMLAGKIPAELGNLTSLRTLNLSHNELEGPVPAVGILKSFNSSSFGVLHSHHRPRHTMMVVVISVIVSAIISLLFCIAFIRSYWGRRKNNIKSEELSISMPGEPLMQRFTKRDLEIATESFSADNIIGSSTISTVYRGVLRNGKVVAVKTLKMENSKDLERCFKRDMYTMARIRHRNLVKVIGYAWDNRLRALVMEFKPNGNLDAVLHSVDAGEGRSAQLDLSKRLSISISIAQALVYLH